MSLLLIRNAFYTKISSINPKIATAYEGKAYTPISGTPYQELYLLPADNNSPYLNDKTYLAVGIFQMTLKYPFGSYTDDTQNRAQLYIDNFLKGTNIISGNITITITNTPNIVPLGQDGDRYVMAVSIPWKSLIEK